MPDGCEVTCSHQAGGSPDGRGGPMLDLSMDVTTLRSSPR